METTVVPEDWNTTTSTNNSGVGYPKTNGTAAPTTYVQSQDQRQRRFGSGRISHPIPLNRAATDKSVGGRDMSAPANHFGSIPQHAQYDSSEYPTVFDGNGEVGAKCHLAGACESQHSQAAADVGGGQRAQHLPTHAISTSVAPTSGSCYPHSSRKSGSRVSISELVSGTSNNDRNDIDSSETSTPRQQEMQVADKELAEAAEVLGSLRDLSSSSSQSQTHRQGAAENGIHEHSIACHQSSSQCTHHSHALPKYENKYNANSNGGNASSPVGPTQYTMESATADSTLPLPSSSPHFIQRMQSIPIVSSALGIYDKSKQSSVLVRVGGTVLETGVRKVCEPLAKRIIDVNQLDDFACRQLDNLGYREHKHQQISGESAQTPTQTQTQTQYSRNNAMTTATLNPVHFTNYNNVNNSLRKRTKDQAERLDDTNANDANSGSNTADNGPHSNSSSSQTVERSSADNNRGRWGGVGQLIASAKERAVAYREDAMRRLRYCLDWVTYATALLNQHIHDLRTFLDSLKDAARIIFSEDSAVASGTSAGDGNQLPVALSNSLSSTRSIHEAAVRLAKMRKEIVNTVRKAVAVISQYAGSVLPGEARRQVRGLILNLPGRWMTVDTALSQASSSIGSQSVASASNGPSPYSTPRQGPVNTCNSSVDDSPANIEANARRTMAFATESFYMLDNVRNVFGNLYTNAERIMGPPASVEQVPLIDTSQSHHPQHQQNGVEMQSNSKVGGGENSSDTHTYRDSNNSGTDASRNEGRNGLQFTVHKPPRRLPLNFNPYKGSSSSIQVDGDHQDLDGEIHESKDKKSRRLSTVSLIEIGEQMRRMDMMEEQQQQKRGNGDGVSIMMDVDDSTEPRRSVNSAAVGNHSSSNVQSGLQYDYEILTANSSVFKRNRTREPSPEHL